MSKLCFITTCMGRLAHLSQSLPTYIAQPDTSCVVVDFSCPEQSGQWVEENFPPVHVARLPGQTRYHPARARNLGAASADSDWLCFIDADICLAQQFAETVLPLLKAGHFYRASAARDDTYGTHIVRRDDFLRAGSYDEVLRGWGHEDDDLYWRLQVAGVRLATFPAELLSALAHDDALRVQFHDLKDRYLSHAVNVVYSRIKVDRLVLTRKAPSLEERERLYEQVRSALVAAHRDGKPLELSVPFSRQATPKFGMLEGALHYKLPLSSSRPADAKR